MLRHDVDGIKYHMLGDPALYLILIVVYLVGRIIEKICFKLADLFRLWMRKSLEGTVDDDVAAKLAIGEGRQEDLEQERLELQAMNSERFRHRFLERNRPWILQHLVELLTPRSLESIGPDGRPVVEYIRDVYADLMAMGEGARRPGDRSDISSDEEDELEKARQGRAFSKLITGIIEANKDDHCHITGRTEM